MFGGVDVTGNLRGKISSPDATGNLRGKIDGQQFLCKLADEMKRGVYQNPYKAN